jgi:hypothetical protein
MMRVARRASLLVALSVASAATAHAKESWFPEAAHTSVSEYRTIEQVKNRAQERFRDQTPSEKRLIPDFSYLCLPDTVDPRGPKGK